MEQWCKPVCHRFFNFIFTCILSLQNVSDGISLIKVFSKFQVSLRSLTCSSTYQRRSELSALWICYDLNTTWQFSNKLQDAHLVQPLEVGWHLYSMDQEQPLIPRFLLKIHTSLGIKSQSRSQASGWNCGDHLWVHKAPISIDAGKVFLIPSITWLLIWQVTNQSSNISI